MSEQKVEVGGTVTYEISDKKLVLKPTSVGRMKRAMMALKGDGDMFDNIVAYMSVIFEGGANDFATKEWLEENVTMPQANKIIDDMRVINGMGQSFFPKGEPAKVTEKDLEESPAPAIPSA